MKQVKDLFASPSMRSNCDYATLNNIAKLLSESKTKVNNILMANSNHQTSSSSMVASRKSTAPSIVSLSDCDSLASMSKLTNYVLFDDETDECLFDLSDLEQSQAKYFAGEIDAIEKELTEVNAQIGTIKNAYRAYYEGFLNLCDRKDELFDMFLDYYEEYFLNAEQTSQTAEMRRKSKPNKVVRLE